MEQPLDELLADVEQAEVRWIELLKRAENSSEVIRRPEILNIGPRPIKKFGLRKITEPHIPKVDVTKIKRNRRDFVSRMKTRLDVLKCELEFSECQAKKVDIQNKIRETKTEIRLFKKNKELKKKYGEHPNQN